MGIGRRLAAGVFLRLYRWFGRLSEYAQRTGRVGKDATLVRSALRKAQDPIKLLTITLAEGFGRIPKGTHHYEDFITPDEMTAMLAEVGLVVDDIEGLAMSPMKGLHLSEDTSLNYLVSARHA